MQVVDVDRRAGAARRLVVNITTPDSLHVERIVYRENDGDRVEAVVLRDGTVISICTPVMHDDAETGYSVCVFAPDTDDAIPSDAWGNVNAPRVPGFRYD